MSIESDLYQTLRGYVADRVYPLTFPQPVSDARWPSIRYTFISADPGEDICGDGGDGTADYRVQLDLVHTTYAALRVLRLQVLAAMDAFQPPAIWSGELEAYDAETKTYRSSLDFLLYPSST
jgi:hypothetical protein